MGLLSCLCGGGSRKPSTENSVLPSKPATAAAEAPDEKKATVTNGIRGNGEQQAPRRKKNGEDGDGGATAGNGDGDGDMGRHGPVGGPPPLPRPPAEFVRYLASVGKDDEGDEGGALSTGRRGGVDGCVRPYLEYEGWLRRAFAGGRGGIDGWANLVPVYHGNNDGDDDEEECFFESKAVSRGVPPSFDGRYIMPLPDSALAGLMRNDEGGGRGGGGGGSKLAVAPTMRQYERNFDAFTHGAYFWLRKRTVIACCDGERERGRRGRRANTTNHSLLFQNKLMYVCVLTELFFFPHFYRLSCWIGYDILFFLFVVFFMANVASPRLVQHRRRRLGRPAASSAPEAGRRAGLLPLGGGSAGVLLRVCFEPFPLMSVSFKKKKRIMRVFSLPLPFLPVSPLLSFPGPFSPFLGLHSVLPG